MKENLIRKGLVFGMIFVLVCMAFIGMSMNVVGEEVIESQEPVPLGGVEDYRLDYDGVVTEWIEQEVDTARNFLHVIRESWRLVGRC